jgi:hypothetical protein
MTICDNAYASKFPVIKLAITTSANNSNFFGIGAGRQASSASNQISLLRYCWCVQHLLIGQISKCW